MRLETRSGVTRARRGAFGMLSDFEDGMLPDVALSWSSDRAGALGEGGELLDRVGDLLQTLLKAAHGPEITTKLDIPSGLLKLADEATKRVPGNIEKRLSKALGAPLSTISYVRNEAVFDDQQTRKALRGSGVLDMLIAQGMRHVFISNSDNLGAVPAPEVRT